MILKLTICGLSILLIVVIALSYYMNEEGFETTATAATANPVLKIGQSVRCKPPGPAGIFRYTAEKHYSRMLQMKLQQVGTRIIIVQFYYLIVVKCNLVQI